MTLLDKAYSDTEFLQITVDNWYKYLLYLHWICKLFYYLDRFHMVNKKTSVCIEGHKAYKLNYFDKINEKLNYYIF